MFNNLLESKAKKQKRFGGTITSVILHTAAVIGLVVVTANAGIKKEEKVEEKVDFVEVKKDEPKPPEPEKPPPPPEKLDIPPPPKVTAPPPVVISPRTGSTFVAMPRSGRPICAWQARAKACSSSVQ